MPFDLETAARIHAQDEWRRELEALSIRVDDDADGSIDFTVGDVNAQSELISRRPRVLLLEGDAARPLRRAGYDVSVYIVLPEPRHPRLVIAPAHRAAAAFALRTRITPANRAKHLRAAAAATLISHGVTPPFLPVISVGGARSAPPFLVAAAEAELGESRLGWFMTPGAGDPLSRGVFFLFPQGVRRPAWVLKFARLPDYVEPFTREEAALRAARSIGPVVVRHAPAPLGRVDVGRLAASIETAAPGRRLDAFLSGPSSTSDKLAAVERVLAWLLEVSSESRGSVDALRPEWRRLCQLASGGEMASIPGLLPETPFCLPVLQHNDLGGWNILVDGSDFVAVDWESSNRFGLPLWDGWYFLAHALPLVANVAPPQLDAYLRRLFRGEDRWSPIVFRWTLHAAAQLGIPITRLGTLATLCWLHHAQSHGRRGTTLSRHRAGEPMRLLAEQLPRIWLDDPGLGTTWRSLQS